MSEEQQSEAVRAVEGVGRTIVDRLLVESAKCVPVGVIVCIWSVCGVMIGVDVVVVVVSVEARRAAELRVAECLSETQAARTMYAHRLSYEIVSRGIHEEAQRELERRVQQSLVPQMPLREEPLLARFDEECGEVVTGMFRDTATAVAAKVEEINQVTTFSVRHCVCACWCGPRTVSLCIGPM